MTKRIDTAVILAAGRGSRLKGYTENIPKGFLKIGDETLLERSIRHLQNAGITNIVIGTGYKAEAFEPLKEKYGVRLYCNQDYHSSESFYTLFLAQPFLQSDFLLLESDILYDPTGLSYIVDSPFPNTLLASGFTNSNDEVYLRVNEQLELTHISQKPEDRADAYAELVGITKISHIYFSDVFANAKEDTDLKKIKYEFAFMKYQENLRIKVSKLENLVWCEIDDEAHLKRAQMLILPKLII